MKVSYHRVLVVPTFYGYKDRVVSSDGPHDPTDFGAINHGGRHLGRSWSGSQDNHMVPCPINVDRADKRVKHLWLDLRDSVDTVDFTDMQIRQISGDTGLGTGDLVGVEGLDQL